MKKQPRQHYKTNYTDKIKDIILNTIKEYNQFIEEEHKKIESTNEKINQLDDEYILLNLLSNSNYKAIQPNTSINEDFNLIPMLNEDVIDSISICLNEYQSLFLKTKDKTKFDELAVKEVGTYVISLYKFVRLLHKFRLKKENKGGKNKGGYSISYQPLTSYINSLNHIIDNTLSEALKDEAQKEKKFFVDIKEKYKQFKKYGELFEILHHYNEELKTTSRGNQFLGFIPKKKITQKQSNNLERELKKIILQSIPLY